MATASNMKEDLTAFHDHLNKSNRIVALLGAGISASSGLATFRGAGGLWRNHDATSIATPEAFEEDPALVWRFYSYRRHKALQAEPNPAHYALAELARRKPRFLTLSQNVDGLSPRAGHPPEQLKLLHGSLFQVRCHNPKCDYQEDNYEDPIVPALAIPTDGKDPTTREALEEAQTAKKQGTELDISDASVPIEKITTSQLPHCPKCENRLLRPNVVWFGENLPRKTIEEVDEYMDQREGIDLIMVIGTSAKVYPAAGYSEEARDKGASVCVINMDPNDRPPGGWKQGDWFFQGDAAELVPKLLEPVIGTLRLPSKSMV
ncbi:NAD-dependent deacetylase sirtuin-5 [Lecanosticta acicola]|uniref:NAD-dependent protein deacylase n=1 Tax=Lecanosticta acicola TaxID=111012 RepID=A0AAI8YWQ1_9PEZI|nr:NAD-dependent deacetylase sirtuin-5 [Lecanosticta acicola]